MNKEQHGPLKDHEKRELVNELRDIAVRFHAAGQLRDRIAHVVIPALERTAVQRDPSTEELLKMIGESTGRRINLGLDDLDQYLSVARAAIKLSRT